MKICFVIPMYKDEVNLKKLYKKIKKKFLFKKIKLYFVVINDGSEDKFNYLKNISNLRLINLKINVGSQKAIQIGINYALKSDIIFEYIIIMDSDGEDDPKYILPMIKKSKNKKNKAVIFASRKKRNESIFFKFLYNVYKIIFKVFTWKSMDIGNYSIIHKNLIKEIIKIPSLGMHFSASVVNSKMNIEKVPSDKSERYSGISKMNYKNLFFHAFKSLFIFRKKISLNLFFLFFLFSIILNFFGFYNIKLTSIFLTLIFFIIFVISNYIQILDDSKHLKNYIKNIKSSTK